MDWKDFGSPNLMPTSNHLLAFNRRTSEPLGILPQIPITLGGKTIFIDVMVVQGPLDFSFLLGHDYIYAMKVFCPHSFKRCISPIMEML